MRLQAQSSVADSARISLVVIARPSDPVRSWSAQLRVAALALMVGILLTLITASTVDGWLLRRATRAGGAEPTSDPAGPDGSDAATADCGLPASTGTSSTEMSPTHEQSQDPAPGEEFDALLGVSHDVEPADSEPPDSEPPDDRPDPARPTSTEPTPPGVVPPRLSSCAMNAETLAAVARAVGTGRERPSIADHAPSAFPSIRLHSQEVQANEEPPFLDKRALTVSQTQRRPPASDPTPGPSEGQVVAEPVEDASSSSCDTPSAAPR